MPIARRRTLALIAAACLCGVPLWAKDHPAGLHVHDAYVRVAGGQGASAAVFFLIHNNSDHDITLSGVTSDLAQMAGLHAHVESAEGLMQMIPIEGGVLLPFGEMHEFAPGGDHVMLMGLTRDLAQGEILSLTLTFDGAGSMIVEAVVDNDRAPDAAGRHDHSAAPTAP